MPAIERLAPPRVLHEYTVHRDPLGHWVASEAHGQFGRGSVGAGTGMRAFAFKAGIGSASRKLPAAMGGYTLGVLLNANTGLRRQLTMAGVPVGKALSRIVPPFKAFGAMRFTQCK